MLEAASIYEQATHYLQRRKVSEEWPAKIQAAQLLSHYTIAGQKHPRIRFGDEGYSGWGEKPCLNCAVLKGQFHVPDCEYEKCPACGESRSGGCACDTEELRESDKEMPTTASNGRESKPFKVAMICFFSWQWEHLDGR